MNRPLTYFRQNWQKRDMGLLLFACSRSASFGIGLITAIFQSRGKIPETSEVLIMEVIVGRIATIFNDSHRDLVYSRDLLVGVEETICLISSVSTVSKINCSDSG